MKIGDIVYLKSDLKSENPLTITSIETYANTKVEFKTMEVQLIEEHFATVSYFAKSKFGESKIDFKTLPIESLILANNDVKSN